MQCTPSSTLFSGFLQVLARPCYLLAPHRLSRCMSNGTLVRATLVLSCLCVWSCLWRGLEAFCPPSHYSWLEVGLGELVVDVVGVCCKLKSWCDIVVILDILVSLIQRRARPLRVLKKRPPKNWSHLAGELKQTRHILHALPWDRVVDEWWPHAPLPPHRSPGQGNVPLRSTPLLRTLPPWVHLIT
jgi:hypothetical protein